MRKKKQKLDTSASRVYWLRYSECLCWTGLDCCTYNLQSHRIDYNGIWALRGQQHIPSKNLTYEPPTPPPSPGGTGTLRWSISVASEFHLSYYVGYCKSTRVVQTIKLHSIVRTALKFRVPSEWSGTSKGLMGWLVRQLPQRFFSYSFFDHAPDLLGSRTVVQLSRDWSEVQMFIRREEEAVTVDFYTNRQM